MSFFNKKEEVLDLQLTQFGKLLLSKGKFKPSYYQFFDDNVIYDSNYAGFLESQNSAATRIKDNSYQKTQYIFKGAETKMNQFNERVARGEVGLYEPNESIPDNEERQNALMYALHESEIGNQKSPYFHVVAHGANLTGSLTHYTGSNVSHPIPQLQCIAEYQVAKDRVLNPGSIEEYEFSDDPTQSTLVFSDGTIFSVSGEYIMLTVDEYNVSNHGDNFEIEVFEIVSGSQPSEEILLPLFANHKDEIKDVRNYFEILADGRIPASAATAGDSVIRGMFTGEVRDDDSDTTFTDIYQDLYSNPEDCE